MTSRLEAERRAGLVEGHSDVDGPETVVGRFDPNRRAQRLGEEPDRGHREGYGVDLVATGMQDVADGSRVEVLIDGDPVASVGPVDCHRLEALVPHLHVLELRHDHAGLRQGAIPQGDPRLGTVERHTVFVRDHRIERRTRLLVRTQEDADDDPCYHEHRDYHSSTDH